MLLARRLFSDQILEGDSAAISESEQCISRKTTAGRIAFHNVQLAHRRVFLRAVGEFAGDFQLGERAVADDLASLAGCLSRARRFYSLADDLFGVRRVLLEVVYQLVVDERIYRAFHVGVELAFGLPLELRLRNLDGDHGDQAFAHVVARQPAFEILDQVGGLRVAADGFGERRAEAREVRAAVHSVDVVGEREDLLVISVVVLNRCLDRQVVAFGRVGGLLEIQRLRVKLVLVQVLDEFGDAALVNELVLLLGVGAFVDDGDPDPLVEERLLAQPFGEFIEAEIGGREDFGVGFERNLGSGLGRLAGLLQIGGFYPLPVLLLVDPAVAADLYAQPLGEEVDDRRADAVQPAGDLVGVAIEFGARVQVGHDEFGGGTFFGRMHIDGNSTPVVFNGDRIVQVDRDVDLVAEAGKGFIYAVVHDLINEVRQAYLTVRADVHRGAFAHGVAAFELDELLGAVAVRALGGIFLCVFGRAFVRAFGRTFGVCFFNIIHNLTLLLFCLHKLISTEVITHFSILDPRSRGPPERARFGRDDCSVQRLFAWRSRRWFVSVRQGD